MAVYYIETGLGCCLREGAGSKSVGTAVLRDVGTHNGVSLVRLATPQDIAHVRAMGGYVPPTAEAKPTEGGDA